ncbi:MAG: GGDEF domain-containing protein [Pseudobutyrivibrio sp.]|nr:GGDEF domain-containing protein [Pseudobutyrivibrio sp.]
MKNNDELTTLREENNRLKKILGALMAGYTTIGESSFSTGDVHFWHLGTNLFANLNMGDSFPAWSELVPLYAKYGVCDEDRAEVLELVSPKYLQENLSIGDSIVKEYRNNNGVYGEVKIVRIDEDSILMGFTERNQEITERQEKIYLDSLTKVKNRKYYDEQLSEKTLQALVVADIDHFKMVNDNYGHECGDIVLAKVAEVLNSSVRSSDEVARYGGDEFVLGFTDIKLEALEALLERVRQTVEKIRLEENPSIRLSMSFGAIYGYGLAKEMFSEADKCLYEAKVNRNTIIIKNK